jgi:hypothetical protein
MSRRLLVVSTMMILGGLLLVAYSDPAVRITLGGTTGVAFTGTRTFSFTASRTFTFNGTGGFPIFNGTGGFPTGRAAGGGLISTDTRLETFVGVGLLAVGLLLEIFTIFLWQSPARPTSAPPMNAPTAQGEVDESK